MFIIAFLPPEVKVRPFLSNIPTIFPFSSRILAIPDLLSIPPSVKVPPFAESNKIPIADNTLTTAFPSASIPAFHVSPPSVDTVKAFSVFFQTISDSDNNGLLC